MAKTSKFGSESRSRKKKEVEKKVGFPHPYRKMTERQCMEELGHIPYPDQHRREDETVQEFINRDKREQWEVHNGTREYKRRGPKSLDMFFTSEDGTRKYEKVICKGWILVEDKSVVEPGSTDWFGNQMPDTDNF